MLSELGKTAGRQSAVQRHWIDSRKYRRRMIIAPNVKQPETSNRFCALCPMRNQNIVLMGNDKIRQLSGFFVHDPSASR
jgi:hypothetical protein